MAVGRVPNAHSEGQSLEPLCAGNTKRPAPPPRWTTGRRACCGSLILKEPEASVAHLFRRRATDPERHKDTLWQKPSHVHEEPVRLSKPDAADAIGIIFHLYLVDDDDDPRSDDQHE